jgi:hypothetical protein
MVVLWKHDALHRHPDVQPESQELDLVTCDRAKLNLHESCSWRRHDTRTVGFGNSSKDQQPKTVLTGMHNCDSVSSRDITKQRMRHVDRYAVPSDGSRPCGGTKITPQLPLPVNTAFLLHSQGNCIYATIADVRYDGGIE